MHLAHALRHFGVSLLVLGCFAIPGTRGYANDIKAVSYKATDYQSGVQAYRNGDYVKAIGYFRQALAQEADNTNTHYYLGLSLDNLNMGSQAIPEYRYVVGHGQEEKIVAYAQTRLKSLGSTAPVAVASHDNQASIAPNIAMVAAGSQLPSRAYKDVAAQISVPLKNNRNALMVDATLSSGDAKTGGTFIIDTGATYTSISQDLAEQLGMDLQNCDKVYITTANGRIEVPKVVIERLNVNGLEAHNVEATVIQVRHGSSFSGLLGLSFIRQFVLTIDPQAGQLIFQKN